ncbi:2-oxoacid:acceptor oxidoreductase family protein [Christensenellaceae bacterium OttesenSCG-928-M15]|nr:2-oxoacid:acceptor oxidoreductase family protein [Christensenellaceae bacterium OttesenSCG-928-M15]
MNLDIYLVGVGGQGVLTIAELIMSAAMKKGMKCNFFPTKGMAQRGGFVKAQLRIGENMQGPDISRAGADVVISMEQNEALKAVDFLKPDGDMIVYGYKWQPTDVMLKKADYPEVALVEKEAKKRAKNYTYVPTEGLKEGGAENIYLLSAAQKNTVLGEFLSKDDLLDAIYERFPKAKERNAESFEAGQKI